MIAIIARYGLYLILLAIVCAGLFFILIRWILPLFKKAKSIEEHELNEFDDIINKKKK